ncbi:MAG TPA: hypothetical protein VFX01_05800 [Methylophilaceae bacterium]|nr:hypothetical protein [Methylophilaceae bacterium]
MKHELPLNFAADHPAFAGHFPGMPIVPGVMLLDQAAYAIMQANGFDGGTWQISTVKFLSPLLPGEAAVIAYEAPAGGLIRFTISAGTRNIASGSLTLDMGA